MGCTDNGLSVPLSPFGFGMTADAIECIDYARQNGAHIMSNSWGGGGFSQALYDAISRARDEDILFTAAAGNSGSDNDAFHYPSSYDLDNIVAVAATDRNDDITWFSCFGATSVDIGAPGQTFTLPLLFLTMPTISSAELQWLVLTSVVHSL